MKASRNARAGGALGHLLLVVLLALGVFAMHGVGHPSESAHDAGMSTTSSSAMPGAAAPGHMPRSAPHGMAVGGHATDDKPDSSSTHEPAMAMDMLSLCVAVLFGACALTALVRSALTRRQEWSAGLLAQVAAVARPNPPPRGPDLTRLSVLRL
ncbi:hypothetical protein BM536_017705 [Streptomyces phaeoluteigriseus]|uniref:Uncharacterized protein n=1 Tax=Streptomyces phaeoluteigriseus TaxID=114686 RepID=A0A1V6MNE7_9ACTN|nr:DUF6153 family protein [Streptomyces phaeoluteigriseus]OQD53969.1 hypothetical protein BM536_017705 [Streptomyces phaeoluteigriseus]